VPVGPLASGPVDGITDVAGVRVAHVTKIAGQSVRTGRPQSVPDADIWNDRLAAATFDLNGNGELTGAHWIDLSGFLEVPIVLTDTLDVGRADDGVVSWLIGKHPNIGVREDVPLPVVAECDDQGINDIQLRSVHPDDVAAMLDAAAAGRLPARERRSRHGDAGVRVLRAESARHRACCRPNSAATWWVCSSMPTPARERN